MFLLRHSRAWQVTAVGLNWADVSASDRATAERHAVRILREGMAPDQSVTVVRATRRFGVHHVRSELTPYPSRHESRVPGDPAPPGPAAEDVLTYLHGSVSGDSAAPEIIERVSGRMYLGTVKWFSEDRGFGFVTCADPKVQDAGDIFVHGSDICNIGTKTLSRGQDVAFYLQATPAGFRGTSILVLHA